MDSFGGNINIGYSFSFELKMIVAEISYSIIFYYIVDNLQDVLSGPYLVSEWKPERITELLNQVL